MNNSWISSRNKPSGFSRPILAVIYKKNEKRKEVEILLWNHSTKCFYSNLSGEKWAAEESILFWMEIPNIPR